MNELTIQEQIIRKSAHQRGLVIHEISVLERFMDAFIARYFCEPDRQMEFYELILGNNRLSLDAKRKLIDNIFYRVNYNISSEFPDYNKEMNIALMERNFFAHCVLHLGQDAIDKYPNEIGFYRFGKDPKVHWYTDIRFEEILNSIRKCKKIYEDTIF